MTRRPSLLRFCPASFSPTSVGVLAVLILPAAIWLVGCQYPQVVKESVPPLDHPSVGAKFETVAVAGKAMKPSVDPNTPGILKYDHKIHVIDQEITCDACHEISASGTPNRPDHDACSTCHDINIDEPNEDCLMCHVLSPEDAAAGAFEEISVTHVPEVKGLRFDHTSTADDYSKCAQCHNQAAESVLATDNLIGDHANLWPGARGLGMDANNCNLCHTEISKTTPPSSHMQPDFRQAHGGMYAADSNLCMACHTENQCQTCHENTKPQSHFRPEWVHAHGKVGGFNDKSCLMCHSEQACQTCHQQMMPKDHTNFFRRRSHGKIASWDRDRCMNCHKQDYCESCHIGSAPLASAAPYHAPGTPCLECHSPASPVAPTRRHGPLPQESCVKCHRFQ